MYLRIKIKQTALANVTDFHWADGLRKLLAGGRVTSYVYVGESYYIIM